MTMLSVTTKRDDAARPGPMILDDDARWEAVLARNRAADGAFFYSVRTTGVYCRPSCAGRLPRRENVGFHDTCADAERAGFRPCKRCKPSAAAPLAARVAALDWAALSGQLDANGCATTGPLLTAPECAALIDDYAVDERFRSRIVMARHGFGRGEYKYFAYPLPATVAALRAALYPPLAAIANRWNAAMGTAERYPAEHAAFLKRCHDAGQAKPTPLLLRYGAGDYNCLHQDIYGEHVFPLQVVFLLSRPGIDFEGGELVLAEQRPRLQSRAEVVPLGQGEGAIFPVHRRPVQGTRGVYRVNMRHGVSRLRDGHRHTLGVIFHDAR
jgi:uncharacterized protein